MPDPKTAAAMVGDSLLNVKQVANLLGLSERKIWQMNSAGELKNIRIGASRRWRASTVRAYLDSLSAEVVSNG